MNAERNEVRIGCGGGFWGDTPEGPRQLIERGELHYLMLDYLAEVTMSILARMRARNPQAGYVPDFITQVIRPFASEIARQGVKVVVNAGGVNTEACKAAIEKELAAQGIALKVAAVFGDDLMPQVDALREQGVREMADCTPLPEGLVSANAYLGAFPIAQALDAGADIVVTGRCVDSALVLGPLIHEFGWQAHEYDRLSAGSLAGHVIECGPQCTGGFSTDWQTLQHEWADIGFPIAACVADGSFTITKPEGTGGAVTVATVSEQISYETGDPRAYLLPDVCCDWSTVSVTPQGIDRVRVEGARGRAPSPHCKVSATWVDGHRCIATLLVRGQDAAAKARAVARAILERSGRILQRENLGPFTETSVEVLGAEEAYGPNASGHAPREVVLKLAARHAQARALEVLAGEVFPAATGTVQGVAGAHGGRPKVQPVVRLYSFLLDKARIPVRVKVADDEAFQVAWADASPDAMAAAMTTETEAAPLAEGPMVRVPLGTIAYARSGDKGDMSNIAVMARLPESLPLLREQLTTERVKAWFTHLVLGKVERFDWPGLHGLNFLMHQALGGGGVASLRYDPQGKAHAQILLDMPVDVPQAWLQASMKDKHHG
ncbi:acyclic terpene utilization AtuA family protein [Hydrogenophaga sp.]|uniref:acyclic terpene utilization AtuA family protein n=1 Tax=Hydrogenophaga sp. TaxID=1904254 RepID=UPI003F72DC81